uniref:uncharacterized protein LOC118540860 n=1 Tax=Halichoerus grypus TaxID=9711 RepID=UPI001658C5EC|nr:uncharacterized protein LOC118540860 [Halichoerus grypus]
MHTSCQEPESRTQVFLTILTRNVCFKDFKCGFVTSRTSLAPASRGSAPAWLPVSAQQPTPQATHTHLYGLGASPWRPHLSRRGSPGGTLASPAPSWGPGAPTLVPEGAAGRRAERAGHGRSGGAGTVARDFSGKRGVNNVAAQQPASCPHTRAREPRDSKSQYVSRRLAPPAAFVRPPGLCREKFSPHSLCPWEQERAQAGRGVLQGAGRTEALARLRGSFSWSVSSCVHSGRLRLSGNWSVPYRLTKL